jgi:hypothetical protein
LEVLKTEALIGSAKLSDVARLNRMRKFGQVDNSRFSSLCGPSYFIDHISPVITINPTKSHVPFCFVNDLLVIANLFVFLREFRPEDHAEPELN